MDFTSEKYLTVAQDNCICQTAYAKNKEKDLTIYQKQLISVFEEKIHPVFIEKC
jgi:hypothetical protein